MAFDAMPKQLAPERGFVATANSATAPECGKIFTTTHCEPLYRTRRIEAELAATPLHTVDTMTALQADVVSTHAPAIRDVLLALCDGQPAGAARALDVLRAWDGSFATDSAGAALYALIQHELPPRLFGPLLGPGLGARFANGRRAMPRMHALLLDPGDPLRADLERAAGRPLAAIVRDAVAAATTQLAARQGAEPSGWRWGEVHRVWLGTVIGLVPRVGRPFVALDAPFPGDEYTVSPSRALPFRGRLYAFVGATSRFVCDLSNPDEALFAHAAGPSADPHTTYFAGLSATWQRFEYFRSALWRAGEVPDPVERVVVG